MCGIAGIVSFAPERRIESRELEHMVATLTHRGPDGMDTFADRETNCCALGHTRLAVIDPVGGAQPMSTPDGKYYITYNGECYNFSELRRNLEQKGHRFTTHCDTEVILHLYQEMGPKCVKQLRGMFALAIWDKPRRQLFLARDRMGQKPLYYAVNKDRFIFASECKAILATNEFPRQVDMHAIMSYLSFGYVSPASCAFADIRPLPPGHALLIHQDNYMGAAAKRYWSLPAESSFTGTFEEAIEQTRALVTEATRIRMVADVPLGAFLSGGLDSSAVVACMSEHSSQPVKTCAIGFAEGGYNETSYAGQVARRFGCDHEVHRVTADCHRSLEKLAYYYDEPFADSSALPTLELATLARPRVTVALTGDGGDECFGGYDRYKAVMLAQRWAQSKMLKRLAAFRIWDHIPAGEHHSRLRRVKRFLHAVNVPVPQRYLEWICLFDPDALKNVLREDYHEIHAMTGSWHQLDVQFGGSEGQATPAENVGRAMFVDGLQYLPGDLNVKVDRAAMAVGLELRCPFQDHHLVEFAYSLPPAWRHNGSAGKVLLRRAFSGKLPGRVAGRRKMGFGVPVGKWFRRELRDVFVDTVLSARARQRGYFNSRQLETMLDEHDHRRDDHGHRFWALLMLELWHQRYIDRL